MNKKLQITLYITALYFAVWGVLNVFAPGLVEQITKNPQDKVLGLLYGLYILLFAYVALEAARAKEVGKLWLITFLLTVLHVAAFLFLVFTGEQEAIRQAVSPIIANSILAVLLFAFRKQGVTKKASNLQPNPSS